MSVVMATFMVSMIPRASVSADRIQEVLDTDPSVVPPADPVREVVDARRARVPRRRLPLPRRRAPGARPTSRSRPRPARPPRSSAAPARARRRSSTSSCACSTAPRAPCSSAASTCATSIPTCCGARSGSCPQRPYLFSGTVASNLQFGKPDATEEEMWAALEVAQASDFVPRHAGRACTPGSSRAAPTCRAGSASGCRSPGRSIRRPDIYVFDDSFSALDLATDARLRAALGPYTQGRRGRHRGAAGVDDRDRRQHPRARGRRGHRPRHARRADARLPDVRRDRAVADRREERAHDAHRRPRERRRGARSLGARDPRRRAGGTRPACPASGRRTSRTRCAAWCGMLGPMWIVLVIVVVVAVVERDAQRARSAGARARHRHHRQRRRQPPGGIDFGALHHVLLQARRAVRARRRCCRSSPRTCSPASSSG